VQIADELALNGLLAPESGLIMLGFTEINLPAVLNDLDQISEENDVYNLQDCTYNFYNGSMNKVITLVIMHKCQVHIIGSK
jgi:hypothetical protein